MTRNTDDFAGTGALSANWTVQVNTVSRLTGQARGETLAVDNAAYWSGSTWLADQSAEIVIGALGVATVDYVSAIVRATGTGGSRSHYEAYTDGTSSATGRTGIQRIVNGVVTTIQDITGITNFAASDRLTLTVRGPVLRMYRNGAQIGTDQVDGYITAGAPGISFFGTVTRADSWEGADMLRRVSSLQIAYT